LASAAVSARLWNAGSASSALSGEITMTRIGNSHGDLERITITCGQYLSTDCGTVERPQQRVSLQTPGPFWGGEFGEAVNAEYAKGPDAITMPMDSRCGWQEEIKVCTSIGTTDDSVHSRGISDAGDDCTRTIIGINGPGSELARLFPCAASIKTCRCGNMSSRHRIS